MPKGAERVTTYFCFRGPGIYYFDRAMMNVGGLADYTPGPHYPRITPLGRRPAPDEIAFTPRSWDENDRDLDDPAVRFAFDADVMSYGRISKPTPFLPKRIGVEFSRPALIRGLSLLLDRPGLPDGVTVTVSARRGGKWGAVPHRLIRVGSVNLLQTGPIAVQAIRIEMTPQEGRRIRCPKIFHIGIAQ